MSTTWNMSHTAAPDDPHSPPATRHVPLASRSWPDVMMLLSVGILLSIGIIMIFSATPYIAFQQYHDSFFYIRKHLSSLVAAIVFFLFGMSLDYHNLRKIVFPLFLFSFFLTALTLIPGIGHSVGGAARWLKLGPFTFQPSELIKLSAILFAAQAITAKRDNASDIVMGLFPVLIGIGILALPILLQPDLGTTMVVVGTVFFMLFLGGVSFWHLFIVTLLGVRVVAWLASRTHYQQARLLAFVDPWKDSQGIGFHIIQSLLAVGSGGFFGLGLGHSKQKFAYLPNQFTDFIFAILCEEGGFIIAVLTIMVFVFFVARGLRIALKAPDRFGQLLASGITVYLGLQAFLNIAVVVSLLPMTGVPLTFISLGGSALAVNLFAVGVLANISQYQKERT